MKKNLLAAFFAALWYFCLVPATWHIDDEAIFGESRKFAAQTGAMLLAAIPPTILTAVWRIKKGFK
jgi:hypothetical protein